MSVTLGIDLGTTNSVVATIGADGTPTVVQSSDGRRTVPSVVAFDDSSSPPLVLVGDAAAALAAAHPQQAVWGVKRLIGRRADQAEIRRLAATLPYELVAAPNGDAWVRVAGAARSPQEISAHLVRALARLAANQLGASPRQAIVTVPAYFDNQQRQATKDAAAIAGLEVRRLINEPTAAALGYRQHLGGYERVAVCDLGGGTFDVSIVQVGHGVFEVISTRGDVFLGGDDIDRAIVEELVREVRTDHSVDLAVDPRALAALKVAARDAKHVLSDATLVEMEVAELAKLPSGRPLALNRRLTRGELEIWARPILAKLERPCREALAGAGLTAAAIDAVILVGGMTRMPAVVGALAAIFGKDPIAIDNPEEIVALGAASQAQILDGGLREPILLDVTSRALALSIDGTLCQVAISRNATIPTREHKILVTTQDGQRELSFDIFEGESRDAVQNRHLGRFVCDELPSARAGEVLLMVDLTVDSDGILSLAATELASGQCVRMRRVAAAGLTSAERERLTFALAQQRV